MGVAGAGVETGVAAEVAERSYLESPMPARTTYL